MFHTDSYAGQVDETSSCIDEEWLLPKGKYIKQFCWDYETPDSCPTVMHYDSDQDRLTISYTQNGYQYDIAVERACQYVNSGHEIQMRSSVSKSKLKEGQVPMLRLYAFDEHGAEGVSLGELTEQTEPALVKLEQNGSPSKTCKLTYYSKNGVLTGKCETGQIDDNFVPFKAPVLMTDVRSLAMELVKNETVLKAEQDAQNRIHADIDNDKKQQREELWLYTIRSYLGVLPGVDARADKLSEIKQKVEAHGFDSRRIDKQQFFALHN